jgi:hypothetical protein
MSVTGRNPTNGDQKATCRLTAKSFVKNILEFSEK